MGRIRTTLLDEGLSQGQLDKDKNNFDEVLVGLQQIGGENLDVDDSRRGTPARVQQQYYEHPVEIN